MHLRTAALREGILAGSPDEVERLAPSLIELAVQPLFDTSASSVRRWWRKCRQILGLRTAETRAALALTEVARCWVRLSPLARSTALAIGRGRWAGTVEGLTTDPNPLIRASVCELSLDAGDPQLAGLCVELLNDSDDQVALRAERALLGLALRAGDALSETTVLGGAEPLSGEVDGLFGAVAAACRRFGDHRRRGVLLASLVLLDRRAARFCGGRGMTDGRAALATWFSSPDADSLSALRTVLASTRLPLARLRALEWLDVPGLADAAVRRLSFAGSILEHDAVLANSHVLLRPACAARVARLPLLARVKGRGTGAEHLVLSPRAPVPGEAEYSRLSLEARRGLPRFVRAIGADARVARSVLGAMIADDDAAARHAACRVMPSGGLPDFTLDRDERVARSGALRWCRAGGLEDVSAQSQRSVHVATLSRSPFAFVRRLAADERAFDAPAGTVWSRIRARRRLASDPAELLADLRRALADRDEAQRLEAVLLIRRLGLAARFEEQLAALALESDRPHVAATAVAALAGLHTQPAASALAACVRAAEPRVRANAVEALAGRDPAVLVEFKDDPHHRVRGNILRAALSRSIAAIPFDRAGLILADMLADSRSAHRLAATWVASRSLPGAGRARLGQRWAELAARVVEVARADADAAVRARAAACAVRLDAEVRAAWRQNVPWQRLAGVQEAPA